MKNVYRRYFRVESGPLVDAVQLALNTRKMAYEQYLQIAKEIGAEEEFYSNSGRLVAFVFKTTPDPKLFKRAGRGWYPKRNCMACKQLAARIEAIKTADPQDALRIIGLSRAPSLFVDGYCHVPQLIIIPDQPMVIYVSVPFFDEDPEVVDNYKKEKVSGVRFESNMEAILWQPTPEMVEVRKWEMERDVSEWNEKARNGHP